MPATQTPNLFLLGNGRRFRRAGAVHGLSTMLRIQDHRLVGDGVSFRATPNCGGALSARYLVFHYTAGRSCDSSVESLCTRKPRDNASAHVVLASDGRIVQLAPFNVVTWHAG